MSGVQLPAWLRGPIREQALAKLGQREPTLLEREARRHQAVEVNDLFARQLTTAAIPFEREVKLILDRGWTWDFIVRGLAIEIQGGVWSGGAHGRPWGVIRDIEKMQAAAMAGYTPLFITTGQVRDDDATTIVADVLRATSWEE